jgi:lysophospholipase L1-like esterase
MNEFATIKVRAPLRRWLKQEAARLEVPMYKLLEQLVQQARDGELPWDDGAKPSEDN